MKNDLLNFKYCFEMLEKRVDIDINIDNESMIIEHGDNLHKEDWMKLDFCKCSICSLNNQEFEYCPLALASSYVISEFKDELSYSRVNISVKTKERVYSKECDLQKALGGILGLVMPTSGCPYFKELRAMARFHLPFASVEETAFRVISIFLLKRYLKNQGTEDIINDIKNMYGKIETVNEEFLDRLRTAVTMDSSINAIVTLDVFAKILPIGIEKKLAEMKKFFE